MAEVGEKGKVRAANLTAAERETIVELALKYRGIIENKKTDAVTAEEKEAAWKAVAAEFNAICTSRRNHQQIKQVYCFVWYVTE
jgi:Myb/SANT-like DNA-binding domain